MNIIKAIVSFFKDFRDYLLIRRLNRLVELDESHKRVIFSYDKEIEKELDAIVLHKLSELMVGEIITPEMYRWFRLALTWRISYIANKSKFNIK